MNTQPTTVTVQQIQLGAGEEQTALVRLKQQICSYMNKKQQLEKELDKQYKRNEQMSQTTESLAKINKKLTQDYKQKQTELQQTVEQSEAQIKQLHKQQQRQKKQIASEKNCLNKILTQEKSELVQYSSQGVQDEAVQRQLQERIANKQRYNNTNMNRIKSTVAWMFWYFLICMAFYTKSYTWYNIQQVCLSSLIYPPLIMLVLDVVNMYLQWNILDFDSHDTDDTQEEENTTPLKVKVNVSL